MLGRGCQVGDRKYPYDITSKSGADCQRAPLGAGPGAPRKPEARIPNCDCSSSGDRRRIPHSDLRTFSTGTPLGLNWFDLRADRIRDRTVQQSE
jgi:hypothetical protein